MSEEIYRHYKGGRYKLICLALREGTQYEDAVYQNVETKRYFTRPALQFFGNVNVDGETVSRFTKEI